MVRVADSYASSLRSITSPVCQFIRNFILLNSSNKYENLDIDIIYFQFQLVRLSAEFPSSQITATTIELAGI